MNSLTHLGKTVNHDIFIAFSPRRARCGGDHGRIFFEVAPSTPRCAGCPVALSVVSAVGLCCVGCVWGGLLAVGCNRAWRSARFRIPDPGWSIRGLRARFSHKCLPSNRTAVPHYFVSPPAIKLACCAVAPPSDDRASAENSSGNQGSRGFYGLEREHIEFWLHFGARNLCIALQC